MIIFKSKESIGILFGIFAYLSFSILDTIQKTLIIHHSVFQLLLIKYFFVLFLAFFEAKRKKNNLFYKSKDFKLQIFRSLLSVLESGCFVLSFKYLSLANAHSIGSLAPVIVVALSAIILKEKVSVKTWIAIFIGFLGVLIILRPTSSIFDPTRIVASRSHLNEETKKYISQFPQYELLQSGSSIKLCMVAEGKADVYPRFAPTSEWDTAAAQAVVEGAGGSVLDTNGDRLIYQKDNILNPHFIVKGNK